MTNVGTITAGGTLTGSGTITLTHPTEDTTTRRGKARASGEALRDQGFEAPLRRNGVAMHNRDTQKVCEAAGVQFIRTKADRLWIEAWAVAVLSTLRGKLDTLKVRVLKHYVEQPEEVRAALLVTWRTGNKEALKAMVDPASWTKGAMQKEAVLEERRRRAEARAAKRAGRTERPGQKELLP